MKIDYQSHKVIYQKPVKTSTKRST